MYHFAPLTMPSSNFGESGHGSAVDILVWAWFGWKTVEKHYRKDEFITK